MEYISRKALIDYVSSLSTSPLNEWDTMGVMLAIDHIPAADVVEVVRCRERTYLGSDTRGHYCELSELYVEDHDFCSWAKRMDGGQDDDSAPEPMDNPWTGLMIICLVVIVIIVICCSPASAAECRLEGKPEPETWEPDEAEVLALARTLYGECRGCSELQQRAVCWCIFNRVEDGRFPDTVVGVITHPSQFFGYRESFPATGELTELARECLIDWHNGENRVLELEYLYFYGDGSRNHFTTAWHGGEEWCEG